MTDISHSTHVAVDEMLAFDQRHQGEYMVGGLVWGLMRAVAECPRCPGVFRVPLDGNSWDELRCPACGGVWQHIPETKATKKARKTRP